MRRRLVTSDPVEAGLVGAVFGFVAWMVGAPIVVAVLIALVWTGLSTVL